MRIRGLLSAVVCAVVVAASVSCSAGGRGVSIPPGDEDLPLCSRAILDVDVLGADGAPGCNLTGSTIRFDGSVSLEIAEVGAVTSVERDDSRAAVYYVVNWGVPGVGAATLDEDGRLAQIWGSTPEAVQLHREQLALSGFVLSD